MENRSGPLQMPCTRPLSCWTAQDGGITFKRRQGYSDLMQELPCGKCLECRKKHAQAWAVRCVHESRMHPENSFVTLTYSPSELPSDGSLRVNHFQAFAKALRKTAGKFRYFHCGEYGPKTQRPHYHALIFGLSFSKDRQTAWTEPRIAYTSPTVDKSWNRGFATVQDLTPATAFYIAKYTLKKVSGETDPEQYTRTDGTRTWKVKPEYATMSRRPGIGSTFVNKYGSEIYPDDEAVIDGAKHLLPRYYVEKLDEEEQKQLKAIRREHAIRQPKENLRIREQAGLAKLSWSQFHKRSTI